MAMFDFYCDKPGRSKKRLSVPTSNINGHTINTQAYDRIPVLEASCKCRFLIDTEERPDIRCGLCGTPIIYSYRHDKLVLIGQEY